mmetsp:Transcript_21030/g.62205  ORF Transcript_21030/g.62205 Transcript_21030/m.62205 type:complete len:280 (+) Transcript_21030:1028-1867(+)
MAALLVRVGARRALHCERRRRLREPGEELEVHGCAQVVRVGDKHELVPLRQQRLESAGAEHRRVEVPVAGRAPLAVGLGRPRGGGEVGLNNLWRLVLLELERQPLCLQLGVLCEVRERVGRRGERVHQHEGERHAGGGAHLLHLQRDEVEEVSPLLELEQRLCLLEAHAGAEAAVQLDHHRRLEQRRVLRGERGVVGQRLDRLDALARNHQVGAAGEHLEVVLEGGDCGVREALGAHFLLVGGPRGVEGAFAEEVRVNSAHGSSECGESHGGEESGFGR